MGFGTVEEVPLGLVQPARAVLRDYYNPGETLGILERVGVSGSEEWQGSPVDPTPGRRERASALTPLCFSPEHKSSVFYGAPRKSKLFSMLCSAAFCQCGGGETPHR